MLIISHRVRDRFEQVTATKVFLILFILAAFCYLPGFSTPKIAIAQTARHSSTLEDSVKTENIFWPHEKSDLKPDPSVHYEKLPNGMRVVLMRNNEPKDRVSMHLVIQAGSLHEADDQEGLAHFLEHMLFNGSTHFPPGELVKYFQMIGMKFGPDANAHTSFTETVYDVLLPFGDSGNVEKGLLVLKDYAEGAFLLPEEIERERRVILSEKRSRDSADYRTMIETLGFEFPDARLSKRLPIGDENDIKAVNQKTMKTFYDAWYRPEKMILVMVGDFKMETGITLIREKMSGILPRHPLVPEPDFGKIDHQGVKAFYHYEPEAGTASISIEMVQQVDKENDSIDFQQEELHRLMATRIVQNRLEKLISNPQTPFTSARIHSGRFLEQIFYSDISAESPSEKWKESLHQIEQSLRKALTYGFNPGELSRVKKELIAELDNAAKQSGTRKSGGLARRIIRNLNNNRVLMSPHQEKDFLTPLVDKATITDIHKAFQKSWHATHRLVLLSGNALVHEKDNMTAVDQILTVYRESEKKPVQKQTETAPKAFPYLPEPEEEGNIISQKEISDLGIVQIEYENGIRLNLKKTDFEAGKVRASVVMGKGRSREPADKAGIVLQSMAVMNESGLGGLDKNELAHALAGSDVAVWYGADEDKYTISGVAPSKEQGLMVQLLHAHVVDPGFREEAYVLVLERADQRYQSLNREIDGALKLQGQRFLAGGDKRFGLPLLEELKAISLAEMQSWMTTVLTHSPIELSIVGDFEEKAIIQAASTYFGTLPKRIERNDKGVRMPSPVFPTGKASSIHVDTIIPKGLVVIAYSTNDFWNINRTRRLSVLSSIFSEKLREKIREELGASYSPYAFNRSSRAYRGYGLIQSFVYIAPKEADAVITAVKEIAIDIVQNGISKEEMLRSLKPILTGIKDYRRTNGYWLDSVLTGSYWYPQQLDWSRSFMSDYEAITREEVRQLAKEYLVNEKAATIIITPKPAE
jgi:zinc protease